MYPLPDLRTERTFIRLPREVDAPLLLRYRTDNRDHFAPWEPRRDVTYFTDEACHGTIADSLKQARADHAYRLLAMDPDQHEIRATVTLSNVTRGVFQACNLGYGVAAAWQGKGLMHEALCAVLDLAFGPMELYRVMANYLPHNQRSARLLERLEFEREGYARRYLRIDGSWQDHVLTAKINPREQETALVD